tara:strand:- start:1553 stop:2185 length:633 start_codon:yes stop_codon:yes gene_type:complete
MKPIKEDGRSLRAKNIYDEKHKKLVNTAIDLLNNPLISNEKINISLIAKHAGTSTATAYNHFPDNLLDVYGSIFALAFQDIVDEVQRYNQTESNPLKQINHYVDTQVDVCIELGNAVREGFFQFRELLNSNKWIQGEPYSFLLSMCKEYKKVNTAIDYKMLADDIFVLWNGNIYLWMRFNPDFELWSKFNDEWLKFEMKKIVDKAILLQK